MAPKGIGDPAFIQLGDIERYRGQVSEGSLRNWRSMRVGPSFLKIGKAVLYPLEELDRWDRQDPIIRRPFRPILIDDISKWRGPSSITQNERNVPKNCGHNGSDKD
jgi:hypothetical protein